MMSLFEFYINFRPKVYGQFSVTAPLGSNGSFHLEVLYLDTMHHMA